MGDDMHIYESAENYLEAILALSEHGAVRSIDVAQQLSVSKPSVSRAMSLLRENGYVLMDKDGFLTLTDTGLEIAQRITSATGCSPSGLSPSACLRRSPPRTPARSSTT